MTVHDLNAALLLLTLAGLGGRGRVPECSGFTVYLAVCIAGNRLPVWWPGTFYNWQFWLAKEWAYCALKAAIAVELAWRCFAPFPRARAAAVSAVVAGVAGTAALVLGLRFETLMAGEYGEAVTELLPRIQIAVVWTFVLLLAAITWWRIPVTAFTRAIVLGFVLYGGAYAGALEAARHFNDAGFAFLRALDPAAYAASVAVWALAAWRPREGPVSLATLSPAAG